MKPQALLLLLLLWACQSSKHELLARYEQQIQNWERQTLQGKILDVKKTDSIRSLILKDLKTVRLTRNQADWLNALNTRYEIFRTKQLHRFPEAEIPEDIRDFLQLSGKITPQNLAEQYEKLAELRSSRKKKLVEKTYRYLEKYRTLYVDRLKDADRLRIEKIRLTFEN